MLANTVKKNNVSKSERHVRLLSFLVRERLTFKDLGGWMKMTAAGAHKMLCRETITKDQLKKVRAMPLAIPDDLLPRVRD